ncbi:MAG: cytochrome b [Pseudomonadota bacterium]
MSTSSTRYTTVAIALHWIIALLIIGQIAGGWYMNHVVESSRAKFGLYQLHKSFGVLALLVSFGRLYWRLTHKAPALPEGMPAYERIGAQFTHIAFYTIMIGIPLSGWLMVSVSPKEIPTVLFQYIPWPHIPGLPKSELMEYISFETHKIVSYATIALLGLHIGAALKHHIVNKDDVLTRMLPFLKRRT